jgi:2-keto-3-deoxy-L-rhamnonate aldolase RhmA
MYRENRLKARLGAGDKCLGCWLWLGSPDAAEILALAGFDVLMIDHEHGPGNFKTAIDIMRAASVGDSTVIMRVESDDAAFLKRALDAGVEGVMVPNIESAEQARAVVRACRYPPRGRRGAAFSATRASDYGLRAAEYAKTAADNLLVIAQIESATAVENIEQIAAVDGIDMLFIGPTDLSGSVDKLLAFDDPEVLALIEAAERGIKQAGKKLGGIVMGGETVAAKFDRGYDLLVAGGDVVFLREGAKALRAQAPAS